MWPQPRLLFSIEYQILILPSTGSRSAEEYVEIAKPGFDSIATRDTSGECMVVVRLDVEATMRSSTATSCSEVPMFRGGGGFCASSVLAVLTWMRMHMSGPSLWHCGGGSSCDGRLCSVSRT